MKIGILSNNPRRCQAVMVACSGHDVSWNHEHDYGSLDLLIVAGWPEILKPEGFEAPKFGTWNCHAGPVPEYRGGSPLNWQIIDGRTVLEVSLLKMDEGIDTGPVINISQIDLYPTDTVKHAHEKADWAFRAMVEAALRNFPPATEPQPESDAYRPQRTDDMGEIDLTWGPERIHDFVRALTRPYPGAWIDFDGKRLRIWETSLD